MKTLEKIKNGTIRIEDGKLIGLGTNGDESIDIVALQVIFESVGKSAIVQSLDDAIVGIAEVNAKSLEMDEGETLQFINNYILAALPDSTDLHYLSLFRDALKK